MNKIWFALLTVGVLSCAGISYYHVSASNTEYGTLPKEKQEIQERKDKNKIKAKNDSITKNNTKDGPLVIQKDRTVTPQIIKKIEDQVNDQRIRFTNGWVSPVNHQEMNARGVTVETGALKSDPAQGIVVVLTDGEKRKFVDSKEYKTPSKHGEVRVIDYDAFDLTLEAEDKTRWIFNVPTGTFK
ncbi:hypothetical protein ACFQ4X_18380 [Fictibacillus halophilus]|uniref:hypothetical protein n=1 Tax=Fictibacillus halophilus TaxID=1610490 RepID=UPI00362EEF16